MGDREEFVGEVKCKVGGEVEGGQILQAYPSDFS